MDETVVVTGAFSYTGKYATRLLLQRGYRVRTLTSHPEGAGEFGDKVAAVPYSFNQPEELRRSLEGASMLINTYWVRFTRGAMTFEKAVENSRRLIEAAVQAGVRRVVHVSIANPSLDSPLGYYRGKAQVEELVRKSGLSYTIVRPTVIFGTEDILINNIAWFVRHLPVFGIPGDGRYGIRPIYVEDMARLLVDEAAAQQNRVINAVGAETLTFEELVRLIARAVGRPVRLTHMPKFAAYLSTLFMGWWLNDVVLTWEEYAGLMTNLLAPDGPAVGPTSLTRWLAENAERVGREYASEVARHYTK